MSCRYERFSWVALTAFSALSAEAEAADVKLRVGYAQEPEEAIAELAAFKGSYSDRAGWEARKRNIREGMLEGMKLSKLPEKTPLLPEFYERRFGRKTRILGGIMLTFGGVLNMGLFVKIGSMFIVGITGLSAESWALPAVMVFLIGLVLAYTCLGGMISVVIHSVVCHSARIVSMASATLASAR